MAGGALVAGNTVVLKPAEEAPCSGALLAELRPRRALPAGVVQPRARRTSGPAARWSTRGRRRRLHRLGRGRARDRPRAPQGRYAAARCSPRWAARTRRSSPPAPTSTRPPRASRARPSACRARSAAPARARSSSRERHDELVERLVARAAALAVGDPADATRASARSSTTAAVERYRAAVGRGAPRRRVVAGGGRPEPAGCFVAPTVVTGLPRGHRLTREELFLPFLTVTAVDSLRRGARRGQRRRLRPDRRHLHERRGRGGERSSTSVEAGVLLRQPPRRRDHRRVAGHPVVLRLEVQRLDRQGRPRAVLPAAVHARAEPDDRALTRSRT